MLTRVSTEPRGPQHSYILFQNFKTVYLIIRVNNAALSSFLCIFSWVNSGSLYMGRLSKLINYAILNIKGRSRHNEFGFKCIMAICFQQRCLQETPLFFDSASIT